MARFYVYNGSRYVLAGEGQTDSDLSSTSTNPIQNKAVYEALSGKVDKVSGKGLSTNDYTTAEKEQVAANTAARHSHDNKEVLDGVTAEKIAEWDSSSDNIVQLYGTWLESNNSIDFDDIPAGSTAYGIIRDALIAGKLPILCITNVAGDWDAYFHLCRSDSTEYQFSSFETDSSGGPLLGIVWVRANAAGYQGTVPGKLATARTIQTNLASTSSASFDGTSDITPGVTGTLPIANGGTGATTASNAVTNLGIADYIVEQVISPTGWTYRKWNSGLAECWGRYIGNVNAAVNNWSGYYYSSALSVDFPFEFKTLEAVNFDGGSHDYLNFARNFASTVTQAKFIIAGHSADATNVDIGVSISAKGRWK